MAPKALRIAFVHPDLGIGGAERLIVDAAVGLQKLGHWVDVYTSHHDPGHCFEETKDGTLRVHAPMTLFPRSLKGKFHIVFANARQLHLTAHLLSPTTPKYDVYFVDQLSTCIPFLRAISHSPVLFYLHFPDKLLSEGAYEEGKTPSANSGLLKRLYRAPVDWLEEATTRQADVIIANSNFTARVVKRHFPSIKGTLKVVHPGIDLAAYKIAAFDFSDSDITSIVPDRPSLLSLNRFEKKKNAALAVEAFALLKKRINTSKSSPMLENLRLVLAGGYDPRLEDNMMTLVSLIDLAKRLGLSYALSTPSTSSISLPPFNTAATPGDTDVLFLLNFSTPQRGALLSARSTLALLYTPTNEHFGIVPVEAMVSGLPVLAANSGGPTESVLDPDFSASSGVTVDQNERTGWLRDPNPEAWVTALEEIVALSVYQREELSERAKARASKLFSQEEMTKSLEISLKEAVALGPIKGLPVWLILLVFTSLTSVVAVFAARFVK